MAAGAFYGFNFTGRFSACTPRSRKHHKFRQETERQASFPHCISMLCGMEHSLYLLGYQFPYGGYANMDGSFCIDHSVWARLTSYDNSLLAVLQIKVNNIQSR